MQKWTALLLFALLVGFGAVLFLSPRWAATSAGPDAGRDGEAAVVAADDAGVPTVAAPGDTAVPEPAAELSDAGGTLLSGEPAPPLDGGSAEVTWGAILVQYRGAQGAPPSSRTREAALELAKQLAADARQDFRAAVAKGDKGSQENVGRIGRGFLEPAPEFVLFSLPKGGVSEPVDTPRGFLIYKRIE